MSTADQDTFSASTHNHLALRRPEPAWGKMAESDNDNAADSAVKIARSPDAALIVGPEKKKLLVSSAVLSNASKYFATLFGPNFREGQDVGKDILKKEISMPEDDAEAVEVLCHILHLRSSKIPTKPAPQLVMRVALVVDKLDCIESTANITGAWLRTFNAGTISHQGHMMAAAYILDKSKAFMNITRMSVIGHKGSYITLANQCLDVEDQLVWRIICLLENRRTSVRQKLQHIIFEEMEEPVNPCVGGKEDCVWYQKHLASYVAALRKAKLVPGTILNESIAKTHDSFRDMPMPDDLPENICTKPHHRNFDYKRLRTICLEKFLPAVEGLCLDCLRSSMTGMEIECRVKHKKDA